MNCQRPIQRNYVIKKFNLKSFQFIDLGGSYSIYPGTSSFEKLTQFLGAGSAMLAPNPSTQFATFTRGPGHFIWQSWWLRTFYKKVWLVYLMHRCVHIRSRNSSLAFTKPYEVKMHNYSSLSSKYQVFLIIVWIQVVENNKSTVILFDYLKSVKI